MTIYLSSVLRKLLRIVSNFVKNTLIIFSNIYIYIFNFEMRLFVLMYNVFIFINILQFCVFISIHSIHSIHSIPMFIGRPRTIQDKIDQWQWQNRDVVFKTKERWRLKEFRCSMLNLFLSIFVVFCFSLYLLSTKARISK